MRTTTTPAAPEFRHPRGWIEAHRFVHEKPGFPMLNMFKSLQAEPAGESP